MRPTPQQGSKEKQARQQVKRDMPTDAVRLRTRDRIQRPVELGTSTNTDFLGGRVAPLSRLAAEFNTVQRSPSLPTAGFSTLRPFATLSRLSHFIQRVDTPNGSGDSPTFEQLRTWPDSRWREVEEIAKKRNPSFNVESVYGALRSAMKGGTGAGTNEDKIYQALLGLNKIERLAVRMRYRNQHTNTLYTDLTGELSGSEELRAVSLLAGDMATADAAALFLAMNTEIAGFLRVGLDGTDEAAIWAILRHKSKKHLKDVQAAYKKQYKVDLKEHLYGELGPTWNGGSTLDYERATALLRGDIAKADAIAIDQNAHPFAYGPKDSSVVGIESVYKQIRMDVTTQARKLAWNTDQLEAEMARRIQERESSYQDKFGSTLQDVYRNNFSGADAALLQGLAQNNHALIDAATIEREHDNLVASSNSVIIGVLRRQYQRALAETRRDRQFDLVLMRAQASKAGWDKYTTNLKRREIERSWEKTAQKKAKQYMLNLINLYDQQFSYGSGPGVLRRVVGEHTSGTARQAGFKLLDQGYLTRTEEIDFAVTGMGTTESVLHEVFAGLSKEEIEALKAAWEKRYPGSDLGQMLKGELSGRDEFDVMMLLEGMPVDQSEEMKQMDRRADYELENAFLWFGGEARQALIDRQNDLQTQFDILSKAKPGTPEYAQAMAAFNNRINHTDSAISRYREQSDAITDALATTAELTLVIGAALIAGFFSGGTGAVGVLGTFLSTSTGTALTISASTAAGITVRCILKGEAYGIEEMMTDSAVGLVDAAASAATFGTSKALLEGGNTMLTQLARNSNSKGSRALANAIGEGYEGFKSSVAGSVAGAGLDDNNWEQGNALLNIAQSAGINTTFGTITASGLGSLGGLKKPDAPPISTAKRVQIETDAPLPTPLKTDLSPTPTPHTDRAPELKQNRGHTKEPKPPPVDDKIVSDLDPPIVAPTPEKGTTTPEPTDGVTGDVKESHSTSTDLEGDMSNNHPTTPVFAPTTDPPPIVNVEPQTFAEIDRSFWKLEWGGIEDSYFGSVIGRLSEADPSPITPAQLQKILNREPQNHKALLDLFSELNTFAKRVEEAGGSTPQIRHLVAALTGDAVNEASAARFLLERMVATKKDRAMPNLHAIMDQFSLGQIDQLRSVTHANSSTADSDIFNALNNIARGVEGGRGSALSLITLAGPGSATPDIMRLQRILGWMGRGPHSIDAVQTQIGIWNSPAKGQNFREFLEDQATGRTFSPNKGSGKMATEFFRAPVFIDAVIEKVVGGRQYANPADWLRVRDAIESVNIAPSIKNNILGEYWEQINLALLRKRASGEKVLDQIVVKIKGHTKHARIDGGYVVKVDKRNKTVVIVLQEYKTGGAQLSNEQEMVFKLLAQARFDDLEIVLPPDVLDGLDPKDVTISVAGGGLDVIYAP